MDDYSKFCFDALQKSDPEFLRKIDFDTEEKILSLREEIVAVDNNLEICKICKKIGVVQRSEQMRSADEGETLISHCIFCKVTY